VVSVVPDIADEKKRRGCKRRKHANLMDDVQMPDLVTSSLPGVINRSAAWYGISVGASQCLVRSYSDHSYLRG